MAKSASLIRDLAADTFSDMLLKLRIVDWKRFCNAPKSARMPPIADIAESTAVSRRDAACSVSTSSSVIPRPVALKPFTPARARAAVDKLTEIVCPAFAPT